MTTMTTRKQNILVVGAGRMGQIRASILFAHPDLFHVVAIVDADLEAASRLCHGTTQAMASLSEAFAKCKLPLHGIVLSTPTPTHGALIRQIVRHASAAADDKDKDKNDKDDKIRILVEKPVAETAEEIVRLFAECQGVVELNCGFQRRFDKTYQEAAACNIGRPLYAQVWFADHPRPPASFFAQGGANIFVDLAAHDVDYLRWILQDEVVRVHATALQSTEADNGDKKDKDKDKDKATHHKDDDNDAMDKKDKAKSSPPPPPSSSPSSPPPALDVGTLHLEFSQGAVATLFLSRFATYGYDQRCEVFGTRGRVEITNPQRQHGAVVWNKSGSHAGRLVHSFPQRFAQAFETEVLTCFSLSCKEKWPITAQDCWAVQTILNAAQESLATKAVVTLKTPADASSLSSCSSFGAQQRSFL